MNLLRVAGFALTVAIGGAFGALIMTHLNIDRLRRARQETARLQYINAAYATQLDHDAPVILAAIALDTWARNGNQHTLTAMNAELWQQFHTAVAAYRDADDPPA